jgi:fatty-acyl-CoA synthase
MRVEEQLTIEAPIERIWERVCDPARARRFLSGFTRWEVEGEKETGLGARYNMRIEVGSAEVGGLVEVVEFDAPRDMAWNSISGLDHRGRWRLRERGHDCTEVTLRLSYQAPGGLLATVADRVAAPLVARRLRDSLHNLRHEIEKEDGVRAGSEGRGAGLRAAASQSVTAATQALEAVRVFGRAGLIAPMRPDRAARALHELWRFGSTPAAGYAASAARTPDAIAVIDERGELSFADIHRRTNALAHAFSDAGIGEGDGVAIMCRDHRGFVEATVAASKLGANALYMNTAFAAPQLAEVVKRERAAAIVYDEEFAELLADAGRRRKRFVAWSDDPSQSPDPTLESLIASGDRRGVVPPEEEGRTVILTSGTTGTPKGASRSSPGVGAAVAILSRIPIHANERTLIAAPLFHSWGFAHFTLGLLLSTTLILRRRFDPEATLAAIEEHRAQHCPMVPVMLKRILDLPEETRRRYDTSSLRTVAVSGSALSPDLAHRFMDEFGEVVYNLYGSTEVAWASIATPEELRAAPGTAGSPPIGTTLRILDDEGAELPPGQTGRIFVDNGAQFEGYTGGGSKEVIDGLMATGDVGHLDDAGRLFVEGRDDDMIVSGGENVFPQEVEELLEAHSGVSEAAVIGVDDEEWGQRLKAFVVTRDGVSTEDLKGYVKENLARYKVPREIEQLDELPRNQTGKVLKRELRDDEGEGAS